MYVTNTTVFLSFTDWIEFMALSAVEDTESLYALIARTSSVQEGTQMNL